MNTEFKKAIEVACLENEIGLRSELNNFQGHLTFSRDYYFSLVDVEGREKYQIVEEKEAENVLENFSNYDGYKAYSFDFEGVTYYFIKQ